MDRAVIFATGWQIMASDESAAYTETRTTTTRRYWRHTDEPAGWWPWGLLPLLGLLLLFLYGALRTAPHMESDVQTRVTDALHAVGVDVQDVVADGQSVMVKATAPLAQKEFIQAVAEAARCETWRGELDCPLDVSLALSEAQAPEPAPVVEAPPAPAPRAHDFEFSVNENAVTLRGEVANEDERARIVAAANTQFDQVIDELRVSGDLATQFWPLAADRSLKVLSDFQRGVATWTDGVLRARGRVPTQADSDAVVALFNAAERQPPLGGIDVQVMEVVERCNADLANELNNSTIRFRTSSAEIDAGNDALLQRLAGLIADCPGTLTIEGHTDSVGEAEMNQALSEARAASVRTALGALGVDSNRLNARGYGETRPIASNDTRSGRAQNRRIVISIDAL
jgi:outer membrane protein OmpA-like peptidoglycan-associated protein